ncbi:hypothetical protein NC653_041773 [Populus alba x Populus x berolinensis]|uniref:Uncharacterized protein n=1 Tax=Populus alba x Populus x berolinensis TaxID=444605 RepID=A0AAD6L9K1_9ROSI|nr:hypothetical protein NC653_041773 [Populus alba x Populus x berolinensis]
MWQLDVPPNQMVALEGNLFSSGDCLNAWKGHIEAYDGKLNIWNVVDGSRLQTLSSPMHLHVGRHGGKPATGHRPNGFILPWHQLELSSTSWQATGCMPSEDSRSIAVVHVSNTSANEDRWRSFEPMEEEGGKELCSHCCVARQNS